MLYRRISIPSLQITRPIDSSIPNENCPIALSNIRRYSALIRPIAQQNTVYSAASLFGSWKDRPPTLEFDYWIPFLNLIPNSTKFSWYNPIINRMTRSNFQLLLRNGSANFVAYDCESVKANHADKSIQIDFKSLDVLIPKYRMDIFGENTVMLRPMDSQSKQIKDGKSYLFNDCKSLEGILGEDGRFSGPCIQISSDGARFEGHYGRSGFFGICTAQTGDNWLHGNYTVAIGFSGNCILEYANGDILEGAYSKKSFTGVCKLTYKNGDILEGPYSKGAFSGNCTLTYKSSGDVLNGTYDSHIGFYGICKQTRKDGSYIEGYFTSKAGFYRPLSDDVGDVASSKKRLFSEVSEA